MSLYLPGYSLPKGVTNEDQVRDLQRQLGVSVDGTWGPKSQAAYEKANGSASSAIPQGYKNYLSEFQALLKPQTVSYNGASRAELEAALRPSFDIAIQNRQGQTATNKANIDADAAARGMGASTWVTDVKNRQQNAEASDIAGLNASYAQQLQAALAQERANQFAAHQFNASNQASALQAALGLAGNFYGQDLAMAKKAGTGGGGKSSDVKALLNEAQTKYGGMGSAYVNINSLSSKYTSSAIKNAKAYLDEQIKLNTLKRN